MESGNLRKVKMTFFLSDPTRRMLGWREFRLALTKLDEADQIKKVAELWAMAPIQNYLLDWETTDNWPSPWEIINEGYYCPVAIAYLMHQSLALSGWNPDRLELQYIRNIEESWQTMIMVIDNKLVLNYSLGEIVNLEDIEQSCAVLTRYKF